MDLKKLPLVSVIIPVYNTAAYLPIALDSICNQTLKELQIILIDDGSTDDCPQIINEYSQKDARIDVIKQTNQGQGKARNVGISKAKGKYAYFMDSDDILDLSCLETCYSVCEKFNLDYVTFDAKIKYDTDKILYHFNYVRQGKIDNNKIWDSKELLNSSFEHDCFYTSSCLYFIKKELLLINQISYPTGILHEDNPFILKMVLSSQKAKYIPHPFFTRRVRSNSVMTTNYSIRNVEGHLKCASIIAQWPKQHPTWSKLITKYLTHNLNAVVWLSHTLSFKEKLLTIQMFNKYKMSKYVTLRNWLVLFFKPIK